MIVPTNWPRLPQHLESLWQRIRDNQDLLSHQDGYTPQQPYAGLWTWASRTQDALAISESLGFSVAPERLHLQWIKPPGVGFHVDRHRQFSATCLLTPDHPTSFRPRGSDQVHTLTAPQYHWVLFDHTQPHAVLDLKEDRFAVCIDFTGLYREFRAVVKDLVGV